MSIAKQIADLESRIAEIVDALPDSQDDEIAWFTAELAELRAELYALYAAQREAKARKLWRRKANAIGKQIDELSRTSRSSRDDIQAMFSRIRANIHRAEDAANAGGANVDDERAELFARAIAARDGALDWYRQELQFAADRASVRPGRELTAAERQYHAELRITFGR